ncbi:unnamed protein product [Caenorhabditis angaria]|uniref:Uncharacterized protein n=1 Tax=Caenorhabditis angaria TaxID=860376 RepID=A0A9P1IFN2_9PELO|nr:unnamed protein product [Caenorhabditis angaria]
MLKSLLFFILLVFFITSTFAALQLCHKPGQCKPPEHCIKSYGAIGFCGFIRPHHNPNFVDNKLLELPKK